MKNNYNQNVLKKIYKFFHKFEYNFYVICIWVMGILYVRNQKINILKSEQLFIGTHYLWLQLFLIELYKKKLQNVNIL